jgi:hypothetical protein
MGMFENPVFLSSTFHALCFPFTLSGFTNLRKDRSISRELRHVAEEEFSLLYLVLCRTYLESKESWQNVIEPYTHRIYLVTVILLFSYLLFSHLVHSYLL